MNSPSAIPQPIRISNLGLPQGHNRASLDQSQKLNDPAANASAASLLLIFPFPDGFRKTER